MSRDERTVVFQLPTVISGQLACIEGTVAGRSWPLSAGTFVIGRLPGSDLALPQEPGVSKVHAKIIAEGDRYTLVDAESRNGTIVNGHPVQRVTLQDGDEIRICGCVLRFTQAGGQSSLRNPARGEESITTERAFRPPPPTPPPVEPPAGPRPPTSPGFAAGPTEAWRQPPSGGDPAMLSGIATALEPPPAVETPVATQAGMGLLGYFATGLVLSVVVVGGSFAALRFLGDEPSEPAPVTGAPGALPGANAEDAPNGDDATKPAEAVAKRPAADAGTDEKVAAGEGDKTGDTGGDVDKPDGAEPEDEIVAVATPDEEEPPDAEPPVEVWLPVNLDEPSPVVIRARAAGQVRSVEVEDGARVERGQLIAELAEQADTAEIATLKESIRALESVAESQESAKQYLEQEKAKLQRLLAQQRNARITAPASGTLTGFSLKAGDRLRSRQVVGKLRTDARSTLNATVSNEIGKRVKKGAAVKLRTAEGEVVDGRVASVKKRGDGYLVTLDAGRADPRGVDEVSFP